MSHSRRTVRTETRLPAAATAAALVAASLTLGPRAANAQGVATRVTVRAVAHDAKVIGTHVGGARIVILDASTGDTLAAGTQEGGTGDTNLIMRRLHERGRAIYDTKGTAAFQATLSLSHPTRVQIIAEGPLGIPQATERASITTLLFPGQDVAGDGIVLDLHGFAISAEVPGSRAAGDAATGAAAGAKGEAVRVAGPAVPVRARVTMMCGCPITPGGLWDARRITIEARLERDGRVVTKGALDYAGKPSTFLGSLTSPGPGNYRLVVLASDPERANFGQAAMDVRVGGGS